MFKNQFGLSSLIAIVLILLIAGITGFFVWQTLIKKPEVPPSEVPEVKKEAAEEIRPPKEISFAKTIGGKSDEWASSIIQTKDGGYVVAGYTGSFGAGWNDFYIVKVGPSWKICHSQDITDYKVGSRGKETSPTPSASSPSFTVTSPTPIEGSGGSMIDVCP